MNESFQFQLPPSKSSLVEETFTKERHQKTTSTTHSKKINSSIHDSAHVQSIFQTQLHSCHSLSTPKEIEALRAKLNYAQMKADDNVRRRHQTISRETGAIVDRIKGETEDVQQRLLSFAQAHQCQQDQSYREWLEMYIAVLNEWKSERLAKLQKQLSAYQKQIVIESQKRISSVHLEANEIKLQISREEQEKATREIKEILIEIESLTSHESLQYLGSETMTKIDLTIQANAGRKAPGQECKFDFCQNGDVRVPPKRAPVQAVPRSSCSKNTIYVD